MIQLSISRSSQLWLSGDVASPPNHDGVFRDGSHRPRASEIEKSTSHCSCFPFLQPSPASETHYYRQLCIFCSKVVFALRADENMTRFNWAPAWKDHSDHQDMSGISCGYKPILCNASLKGALPLRLLMQIQALCQDSDDIPAESDFIL